MDLGRLGREDLARWRDWGANQAKLRYARVAFNLDRIPWHTHTHTQFSGPNSPFPLRAIRDSQLSYHRKIRSTLFLWKISPGGNKQHGDKTSIIEKACTLQLYRQLHFNAFISSYSQGKYRGEQYRWTRRRDDGGLLPRHLTVAVQTIQWKIAKYIIEQGKHAWRVRHNEPYITQRNHTRDKDAHTFIRS